MTIDDGKTPEPHTDRWSDDPESSGVWPAAIERNKPDAWPWLRGLLYLIIAAIVLGLILAGCSATRDAQTVTHQEQAKKATRIRHYQQPILLPAGSIQIVNLEETVIDAEDAQGVIDTDERIRVSVPIPPVAAAAASLIPGAGPLIGAAMSSPPKDEGNGTLYATLGTTALAGIMGTLAKAKADEAKRHRQDLDEECASHAETRQRAEQYALKLPPT